MIYENTTEEVEKIKFLREKFKTVSEELEKIRCEFESIRREPQIKFEKHRRFLQMAYYPSSPFFMVDKNIPEDPHTECKNYEAAVNSLVKGKKTLSELVLKRIGDYLILSKQNQDNKYGELYIQRAQDLEKDFSKLRLEDGLECTNKQ